MEDLVVLDFSTQEVHFFKVDPTLIDIDDFLKKHGLRESDCSYMFAQSLTIKTHNKNV